MLFCRDRTRKSNGEHTGNVRIAYTANAAVFDSFPSSGAHNVVEEDECACDEFGGHTDVVIEKAMKAHAQKKRVKGTL